MIPVDRRNPINYRQFWLHFRHFRVRGSRDAVATLKQQQQQQQQQLTLSLPLSFSPRLAVLLSLGHNQI